MKNSKTPRSRVNNREEHMIQNAIFIALKTALDLKDGEPNA